MKDTLIIIPAYNEEKSIGSTLSNLLSLNLFADILVINDGSRDFTENEAIRKSVDIITLPYNLGYGAAMQTGFKYAVSMGYQYAIQFDADGQHDPRDIRTIITELKKGQNHIFIGSRFLGRGSFRLGLMKKIAISFFKFIIKITTGAKISDPTSGLQGLSRQAFTYYAEMGNYPKDFPDADVLIQMIYLGYNVGEFPANIMHRSSGESMHSGLKPVLYFVKILLSIMIVLSRKKLLKEKCVL